MQRKDDLLKNTQTKLDRAIESEKQLKTVLSSELSQKENMNSLKNTLVDSQQEIDNLVLRYEKAVEDLI